MSNQGNQMFGTKIEKGIRYNEKVDTYYVQFNFKNDSHVRGFPTLEQAREYRDTVYSEKLQYKILKDVARIKKAELEEVAEFEPYPYNALKAAGLETEDINPEVIEKFNEIILDLTEREETSIKLFYEENYTLEQIGKKFGVTRERVRQIVVKGIKKVAFYIRHYEQEKEKIEKAKALANAREEMIKVCKETGIIPEDAKYYFGELIIVQDKPFLDESIAELDLSVRSYNCLRRARAEKLSDLVKLTHDDLMKVKNLGKKSYKEIVDKLHLVGLHLADEEY